MKNTEKLNRFVQWMEAKNMAISTIKTYNSFLIKFFEYANETNIHHMANMIGHSSVKTTEKYYSHLNYTQLQIHRP